MSKKNKTSILTGILVAIVAVLIFELVTNLSVVLTLLIGFGLGAIVAIAIKAMATGQDPVQAVRETPAQARSVVREPDTSVKQRRANEQLHSTSVAFVTSGAAPALVEPLKGIVEPLRSLVARALEFAPTSETTFNLVKLASDDLPRQLRHFIDLSESDRRAKEADLKTQLEQLTTRLEELTEFINQGRAADFDAQSMFINLKFGN